MPSPAWTLSTPSDSTSLVAVAFAFGITYGFVVWCIAHVSGGHINPAVTFGFLIARKITFLHAILYIVVQTLGALIGVAILFGLTPWNNFANLGAWRLTVDVGAAGVFFIEALISFALVLTVFATCDQNRVGFLGSGPLTIGWAATAGHLWAVSDVWVRSGDDLFLESLGGGSIIN